MSRTEPGSDTVETKRVDLDDLTVIDGIGAARQRWLREALHVATYADLAALPAHAISKRLRDEGKLAADAEIERWLAQARCHAQPEERAEKTHVEGAQRETVLGRFLVVFHDADPTDENAGTCISIRHLDKAACVAWPEFNAGRMANWMLSELGDTASERIRTHDAGHNRAFFSRELEQAIGKTRRLAGDADWQGAVEPARESDPGLDALYSDRLRQVMCKVNRLAASST